MNALVGQWRELAAQCGADIEAGRTLSPYPIEGAHYLQGRGFAFDRCADELDAALRACADPSEETAITGETSDGYHTFDELYAYRKAYNALLFNQWAAVGFYDVHKAWKHHDGEPCFGGGWFIVVAQTPEGQISNHYETNDWELFQVPERERGNEWDGHTPQIALERLLRLALRACAEARPSTEQGDDASPRSETPEIRDRLQSSAPTEGALTTPAPERPRLLAAFRAEMSKIPEANDYRADRYDTDDMHVLHLWGDGRSYDFYVPKRRQADPRTPSPLSSLERLLIALDDVLVKADRRDDPLRARIADALKAENIRLLEELNEAPPRAEALAPSTSEVEDLREQNDKLKAKVHFYEVRSETVEEILTARDRLAAENENLKERLRAATPGDR